MARKKVESLHSEENHDWLVLEEQLKQHGGKLSRSHREWAELLGSVSPSTIARRLRRYEELGLIRLEKRGKGRYNPVTIYLREFKPEERKLEGISPVTGVVPLDSKFYIRRDADLTCERVLASYRNTALPFIRIKGARGLGKTSLLIRLRDFLENKGHIVGFINLFDISLDSESSITLRELLYQFTYKILQEFKDHLKEADVYEVGNFWRDDIAPGINCTQYLYKYIFSKIKLSKTLIIDGIDQVIGQESIQNPFLNLLRTWNETEMKNIGQSEIVWPSIIIAYSTDPYPEYGIKGSVLQNVGIEVGLSEFNSEQILDLVQKYGLSDLDTSNIQSLISFFGGHPALTNGALYKISQEQISLEQLKTQATRLNPFRDFLLKYLEILQKDNNLRSCFQKILSGEVCKDEFAKFQLEQAGLIKIDDEGARVKLKLYEKYFEETL